MPDKNPIPEYLKNLKSEGLINDDNFGIEDITLRSHNDDVDLGEVFKTRGFHELPPLKLLVSGLIRGEQSDKTEEQISEITNKVFKLIMGIDGRGNANKNDEELLHEIAKDIFDTVYGYELEFGFTERCEDGSEEQGDKLLELRPSVRKIVEKHQGTNNIPSNINNEEKDSACRRLERKFKEKEGYYLAKVALINECSEYLDQFEKTANELNKLGIKTDFSSKIHNAN